MTNQDQVTTNTRENMATSTTNNVSFHPDTAETTADKPLPAPPQAHQVSPPAEDANSSDGKIEKTDSSRFAPTPPKLRRRGTMLASHVQSRFVAHKYMVRRPRALQIEVKGEVINVGDYGRVNTGLLESHQEAELNHQISESSGTSDGTGQVQERSTDNVDKQRERLDLFVDLIWVGIVSNLSEYYYEQEFFEADVHAAPAIFIVLFLASWQIWIKLQVFLNSYYMDDSFQRVFVLWILALAVAWGNNSVFTLDDRPGSNLLIAFYIVASNSIVLIEYIYSFWLPWLRPFLRLGAILSLPSTALWICACIYSGNIQFGLIWAAVTYDKIVSLVLSSRFAKKILHSDIHKAVNADHLRSRYESFLIIALGEGVILLIRGSPLGKGVTVQLARAVLSLTLYYAIYSLYFMADMSRASVHPVHRRWWIRSLWQFLHTIYFGAIILLSSSFSYLVKYTPLEPETGETVEARAEHGSAHGEKMETFHSYSSLRTAIITSHACLALVMLVSLVFALMVKSVDGPNTLIVNNRYIRLIPRALSVPVLATMWLAPITDPTGTIGYMNSVVWVVFVWEWYTSMERGCKFLEPKDVDS